MAQLPTTMRAAFIERTGSADDIVYGDLPVPPVGDGQVLVRVEAVTVNPVDTYIRAGAYRTPLPFPFVVGRDLAGRVEATGSGVTRFTPGQRVWCNSLGYQGRQGSFAEYACVEEARLYPLPDGVDPIQAVGVFHPAATAVTGLVHHAGGLRPGQAVYVGGGAGNVGTALIQVAAAMGARLIAAARAEDAAWCQRWGAEAVVDYTDPALTAKVRALAPAGIDLYWDTSGHHDLDRAVELLAPGGTIVLIAGMQARPALPIGPLYLKNGRIIGFALSNATVEELGEAARVINVLLARGRLVARTARVMPLGQAALAHRLVEGSAPEGKVKGRVVLVPEAS